MSKNPQPKTLEALDRAAELRAEGLSWEKVRVKLHAEDLMHRCDERSMRHITREYPDVWKRVFREKLDQFVQSDVETEALTTQRQLLRSEDERIRQSAAHSLLNHSRAMRAKHIKLSGAENEPPVAMVYHVVDSAEEWERVRAEIGIDEDGYEIDDDLEDGDE